MICSVEIVYRISAISFREVSSSVAGYLGDPDGGENMHRLAAEPD